MLGWVFLAGVVMVALLGIFQYYYSSWLMKRMLGDEQDALEYVLDTGDVPAKWCLKYARIVRILKRIRLGFAAEIVKKIADLRFQRRLKKLIAFVKGGPCVSSDSDKRAAIRDLKRIGAQWKRREFEHDPY